MGRKIKRVPQKGLEEQEVMKFIRSGNLLQLKNWKEMHEMVVNKGETVQTSPMKIGR